MSLHAIPDVRQRAIVKKWLKKAFDLQGTNKIFARCLILAKAPHILWLARFPSESMGKCLGELVSPTGGESFRHGFGGRTPLRV
jgi:hypothetical protein